MQIQKSKIKMQNDSAKFKNFRKHFKFLYVILIFTFCILNSPSLTYAQVNIGDKFGFGDIKSVGEGASKGILPLFSLLAAIVVIYFVWGSLKFILSRGNKEEVAEARGMITHAIVGFILLMFVFLILQFLLSSLFGITDSRLFQS